MKFYVVCEQEQGSWGAYCPDLPGVGVVGETREEVRESMIKALEMHLEAIREQGLEIPEPSGEFIEVA